VVRTAVSADGSMIAVAHGGGVVSLHDGGTGQRNFRWDAHPDHEIVCLQFIRPKGGKTMLVTAGAKSDVVYWDIRKLKADDDKGGKRGGGRKKDGARSGKR
jgi:WD40 repeat protein